MPRLPPSLDLTGHIALITGAGSPTGIGFATARALGELGAKLAITGTTDRIHDRVEELRRGGFTASSRRNWLPSFRTRWRQHP